MSFWTGLEAFTGHQPGAFTGMTMKGLFDKDMWDRLPQTWSGKMGTEAHLKANPMDRRTNRAGEPMTTNWARGGGGQTPTPVPQPAFSSPMRPEGALAGPSQYPQMFPYKRQDVQPIPVPGWTPPRNPAEVIQETGPYWGMGDPYSGWGGYIGSAKNAHMGMGASGYQVPSVLDKTTVVKKSADPGVADTQTTTIKEKLDQAGLSLNRTANERVVPATPPGTTDIFSHGQWMPVNQATNWQPDAGAKAKPFWGLQDWFRDMARRRYEDSMKARRGY